MLPSANCGRRDVDIQPWEGIFDLQESERLSWNSRHHCRVPSPSSILEFLVTSAVGKQKSILARAVSVALHLETRSPLPVASLYSSSRPHHCHHGTCHHASHLVTISSAIFCCLIQFPLLVTTDVHHLGKPSNQFVWGTVVLGMWGFQN
jgi:hypothetical protein